MTAHTSDRVRRCLLSELSSTARAPRNALRPGYPIRYPRTGSYTVLAVVSRKRGEGRPL